ncbi:unnamed protein product [Brugia timori]|uniref:Uncharacterized protein n=1 Tax=Brugia timori TaxID=42155 RepID=A0A0R3R7D0_9BILA|nr:unnamed protein product [Brugia timori]
MRNILQHYELLSPYNASKAISIVESANEACLSQFFIRIKKESEDIKNYIMETHNWTDSELLPSRCKQSSTDGGESYGCHLK